MWRRFLSTSRTNFGVLDKNLLSTLRKKTGYPFNKCKEALEKHDNDLSSAEIWLRNQAQEHGWAKATKLQSRVATQGLIGVALQPGTAVMVEVNCETDFVARNAKFQTLAAEITVDCLQYAGKMQWPQDGPFHKMHLRAEVVGELGNIADKIALHVGELGEKIAVCRAVCIRSLPGICVAGYTHPAHVDGNMLGKFGALVSCAQIASNNPAPSDVSLEDVGKQLCVHIVGMKPLTIGGPDDIPAAHSDDETTLIHQEFLSNPEMHVKDFLEQTGVSVLDFERFECGETSQVSDD